MLILLAVVAAGASSCKEDGYDNSPKEPLELSLKGTLRVGRNATVVHIGVTARNAPWTMTGDREWCRVEPTSGEAGISQIAVTFTQNPEDGSERETTFVFTSGEATKELVVVQLTTEIQNPNEDPDAGVNRVVHEEYLNVWYYWNEETLTTPADYNQGYESFFERYLGSLDDNLDYDRKVWSKGNERYLYSYIERNRVGTAASGVVPLNYGMEFDLADYDGRTPVGRILYVMKGSPAEKAGLKRGDWFDKVDDDPPRYSGKMGNWLMAGREDYQYEDRIDSIVNPIQGFSPRLGMLTFLAYNLRLVDENRSVTITPERFRGNPILYSNSSDTGPATGPSNRIIVRTAVDGSGTTRTGYLVLGSFDRAFASEIVAEFERFKALELTHFVLDLRYSKNGSVEIAELLGNLLVPETAIGKTFARYEFNATAPAPSRTMVVPFEAHEQSINMPTIIILTSRNTAGPAELLINALRGIDDVVKLIVVGDVTEGMNVGMVRKTYEAEEWEYDIHMAAFRCYNDKGQGDYRYGLSPNDGIIDEWDDPLWSATWGWKNIPGSVEDRLLERALDFVVKLAPVPVGNVLDSEMHQRDGYPRDFCYPMNMTMDIE